MKRKKDLKSIVERQLIEMLEAKEEPSEGRMKLLKLGTIMIAVNAKLEENEYGEFFRDEPASVPKREKGKELGTGKRTNGGDESDLIDPSNA